MIRVLLFFLFTSVLCQNLLIAQESKSEPAKISKKDKKKIEKSMKLAQKKILNDPVLAKKYLDLINNCPEHDLECQKQLKSIVEETIQGSALDQTSGMTFGICKPTKDSKRMYGLIYSKRTYDCKLSSHGNVYNKSLIRKTYGPGLFWDKQTVLLFCTGPAYGKKMFGTTLSAGMFWGITATSVFGKIGTCVAVGGGKTFGALIGVEKFSFGD